MKLKLSERNNYLESLRVQCGVYSGFMYLTFVFSPFVFCLFCDNV